MNNPIHILQDSLSTSMKKPSIILGVIYFALVVVISLGVAVVAIIAGLLGIGVIAAIGNVFVSIAILFVAAVLALIVLLVIQGGMEILAMKGFHQIIETGNYSTDYIIDTIKKRLFPTIVATVLLTMFYLLVLVILLGLFYLILQDIGIIVGAVLFAIFLFFAMPLFINVTPIVTLESVGGVEAIGKSIRFGARNYLFNLANIVLLCVLTIGLLILSIIPIINLVATIFFTILYTMFLINVYRENSARSPRV